MKIIDLLNKIANGEEVPKKIRFDTTYWNRICGEKSVYYINDNYDDLFIYFFRKNLTFTLNDEVEILEEEPKVQVELTEKEYLEYLDKINEYMKSVRNYIPKPSFLKLEEEKKIPEKIGLINYCEDQATSLIHHKVDEIIDYLKSKGDE